MKPAGSAVPHLSGDAAKLAFPKLWNSLEVTFLYEHHLLELRHIAFEGKSHLCESSSLCLWAALDTEALAVMAHATTHYFSSSTPGPPCTNAGCFLGTEALAGRRRAIHLCRCFCIPELPCTTPGWFWIQKLLL